MLTKLKDIRQFGDEIARVCMRLDAQLTKYVDSEDQIEGYALGDRIYLYKIWTPHTLNVVEHVVYSIFVKDTRTRKGTEEFRHSTEVFRCYKAEGIEYYIIDTWKKDI
jgi:hypothetical protein